MGIVIGILLVIFALSAILLVLIVLVQDDGADGAGMIFGSAASQQYGVRKGNIVTKTTSILAASFLVLAFVLAFLFKSTDNTKELEEVLQNQNGTDTAVEWWKDVLSGEEDNKNSVDGSADNINDDSSGSGTLTPISETDTPTSDGTQ